MRGYRAYVQGPGSHNDPLSQRVDIWIANDDEVMLPGGLFVKVAEGTALQQPTLSIPAEAMESLVEAIGRWQGQPSHAKTEAAVLREWLGIERDRVDRLLRAGHVGMLDK
jgi:hypothetical protein